MISEALLTNEPAANDRAAWLHLVHIPQLGSVGLTRLVNTFGAASLICQASHAALSKLVSSEIATAILSQDTRAQRQDIAQWLAQDSRRTFLVLTDPDYPRALKETPHPPALLYLLGQRETLQRPAIAIVGSRKCTPQGDRDAEHFAQQLAQAGFCVVSGMALGIDAAAHRGAVQTTHGTMAVIGTGIDRVYPARHRDLAHQIAETGLIISEYPLGTAPQPQNFPRRNRIIAGLTAGCLVVEADIHSGSLITARLAGDYGRDVLAVPGSIHNPLSKGCHKLLKEGARLVESVDDIFDELGWARVDDSEHEPLDLTKIDDLIEPQAQILLNLLNAGPSDRDHLIENSGLNAEVVNSHLLALELNGYIAVLPGGRYQRLARV